MKEVGRKEEEGRKEGRKEGRREPGAGKSEICSCRPADWKL